MVAWLIGCGAAAPAVLPPPPPEKILLVDWTLPPGWTATPGLGQVELGHPTHPHYAGSVHLERTPDGLDGIRARWSASYTNTVEDAVVGGRPAVRVHAKAAFAKDSWTAWFVANDRGELVRFDVLDVVPTAEFEALLASVRFLPPPPVPPGATFEVSGTVGELVGSCMPPSPCTPRPLATEVRFRSIGADGVVGDVVASATSGPDGRYTVALPPGGYSVRPMADGEEHCKRSGSLGPCAIQVVDAPQTVDPTVDHAAW